MTSATQPCAPTPSTFLELGGNGALLSSGPTAPPIRLTVQRQGRPKKAKPKTSSATRLSQYRSVEPANHSTKHRPRSGPPTQLQTPLSAQAALTTAAGRPQATPAAAQLSHPADSAKAINRDIESSLPTKAGAAIPAQRRPRRRSARCCRPPTCPPRGKEGGTTLGLPALL